MALNLRRLAGVVGCEAEAHREAALLADGAEAVVARDGAAIRDHSREAVPVELEDFVAAARAAQAAALGKVEV